MKAVPNVYWARELKEWSCERSTPWGQFVMARPIGLQALYLLRRFSIAWKVFNGEYDAVRWTDNN